MNPLLKSLKKQVTCSICLDTYTESKNYIMSSYILLRVFRETCKSEPETMEIQMPRVSGRNRFTARKSLRPFAQKLFFTKVCQVSLKRKIAKPYRGNNRSLACSIRKKEYDITAPRVRRVFVQFASPKTTEAMRLMCLKKQCKRRRKTSCRLSRPSRKRQTCFEQS